MTAGDVFASQLFLRINLHFKAHFAAKLREKIYVSGSLVPEAEVVAFMHFAGMQFFLQNALGKLAWGHQRKVASERKHENRIDSGTFEESQFFRYRGQQLQSGF